MFFLDELFALTTASSTAENPLLTRLIQHHQVLLFSNHLSIAPTPRPIFMISSRFSICDFFQLYCTVLYCTVCYFFYFLNRSNRSPQHRLHHSTPRRKPLYASSRSARVHGDVRTGNMAKIDLQLPSLLSHGAQTTVNTYAPKKHS